MTDLTEWEQDAVRNLRAEKPTSFGIRQSYVNIGTIPVQVQILNELADVPVAARPGDAGFDLRSMQPASLHPGQRELIPTGLALAIPRGFAGFVLPRSGLASNFGVTVANSPGLIDSGYRGEIQVALINHSARTVNMSAGSRIAQLVILPVPAVEFQRADVLPESERGAGGFGSTGS